MTVPRMIRKKYKFFKRKLVFNVEEEVAEIKKRLRLAKVKEMQRINRMTKLEQMTGCQESRLNNCNTNAEPCEQHKGSFFMKCPNFENFNDEDDDFIRTRSNTYLLPYPLSIS